MLSSIVSVGIAWFLSIVFIAALNHKVGSWPRFLAALSAYQLLPSRFDKATGGALVAAEVVTVLALLAGYPAGFLFAAILFTVYWVAMGVNLARGRTYIDCGCGDEPTRIGWGVLLRNGVLIALAVTGWLLEASSPGAPGYAVAVVLAVTGAAIYFALEQLLANVTTHRRLWLGES